ncbi:MAG: hypothetical protein NTV26_07435 [Caldiserica bacterium]|nr:hypothetical protein [Caldisericota bacterium]
MRIRFLGIAVIIALLVSVVGTRQVAAAEVLPYVNVSIAEGYIGQYEEYHIHFLLDSEVRAGGTLSLVFDDNINPPDARAISASDMVLDGASTGGSAHWTGRVLTLTATTSLSADTVHELTILRGAMVQNPRTAMHLRLLLRNDTTRTTLASNYYGISAVSHIWPISLTVDTRRDDRLEVVLRFSTGRNGALTGNPMSPRAFGAPAESPDTITILLSPGLSQVWRHSGAASASLTTPGTVLGTGSLKLVSASSQSSGATDSDRVQVTCQLSTDVAALTEVTLHVDLDGAAISNGLTTDDYALAWTSKEPTAVRVSLTGVPEPVPETPPTPGATDTTAPTVTWTSKASTLLPRLVTLDIAVTEENLGEAWFYGGTGSFIHTRLSMGDNTIMVINRTGIHGTIVASDKAGNTTTVSVDIPAPSGT